MSRANACTMNDDWRWLWWIGAPPPGFCTMTLALPVSGVGALAKVGPGGVGLGRAKWEDLGIGVWGARAAASCNLRAVHSTNQQPDVTEPSWRPLALTQLGLKFNI